MTEFHNLAPCALSLTPFRLFHCPASRTRPFIIPIFLPHAGCPHQCVFCNQVSITGTRQNAVNADQIRSQIHRFLRYKTDRRWPVQISFFGGNFLGLKADEIKLLLDLATEFIREGHVDSIRFSTRPDTINPDRLDFITAYPVETVELGVQSMDDHVLALARRGHGAADTVLAVQQLKEHKYSIGLQMMVGLPGDTEALSMITAKKIAALRPDFVRIYPTLVVKNSRLAGWYQNGTYTPLSLEEAVTRVKNLYSLFKKHHIRVIRMGLQASKDLEVGTTVLAGPYHPAFGHLVYSEIFYDSAIAAIDSMKDLTETITISVNPHSIPKMRGLNNLNIKKLKERYHFRLIAVVPDSCLGVAEIKIEHRTSDIEY
ncbi:MAG: radical SAM protein [Deltaproteobacteria bacterium]|jgi:histone acetyltransferase (RNA polymerase elongator complex component)|nr:radical SAM protein [Deltaproteobacteria bacterium]